MLGLALVALLAFGALSAGAASAAEAPRWKVSGAYLGAGTSKAFTATSSSEVVLKTGALSLASPSGQCTQNGEIEGSAEGSPGKKKNVILSCKKVTVVGAPACVVTTPGSEAGTVTTNSLKSTLVWLQATGKAAGNLLEPTSGTSMGTIVVNSCALAGEYPLINSVIEESLPPEEEVFTSELQLPETTILNYYNNEATRAKQTITRLKMGGQNATLTGHFVFTLVSGERFGISPQAPDPEEEPNKVKPEPRWKVQEAGTYRWLGPNEKRSFTIASTGGTLGVPGVSMSVAGCSGSGRISGSAAGKPGGEKEVSLTCTGAAVIGSSACEVRSAGQAKGVIVMNTLKGTLARASGAVEGEKGVVLAPEAAESWFNLEITGCSASIYSGPITGQLVSKVSENGETISMVTSAGTTKYWNFPVSEAKCKEEGGVFSAGTGLCERTGGLKRSGAAFTIVSTFTVTLAPKLPFGVFFG